MLDWKNKTTVLPRRSTDVSGAYDGGLRQLSGGLMMGTKVISNLGWRVVEGLAVGDKVLTFDHGMQEIVDIRRQTLRPDALGTNRESWPVAVPAGALDNRVPLTLAADQGVLMEDDTTKDDPSTVVTARTLVGRRGITHQPPTHCVELIAVSFARDEVIYVEGAALICCPVKNMIVR